jgi:malonyl-CoA O-methyltransferase
MDIKRNIRNNFGRGASNYAKFAFVQREAAKILFEEAIEQLKEKEVKTILEIGCGTGFLSNHLITYFKEAECFISDVSKEMVIINSSLRTPRLQELRRSGNGVNYLACDGEALPFPKYFRTDLTIASMSLHWFQDFKTSIKNLFKMTNMLAFAVPIEGSFKAWQAIHKKLKIKNRMMQFLPEPELEKILHNCNPKKLSMRTIQLSHKVQSSLEFLRHLKSIGASPNINPTESLYTITELRGLCREADKYPMSEISNYKIAICILER